MKSLTMTAVAVLLALSTVPAVSSAASAKPPNVIDQAGVILRRNGANGVIDPSTTPPTLRISSLGRLRASDRSTLRRLERQDRLDIVRTGSIAPLSGPEIPDESVADLPMGVVHGGYPNPNIGGVRYHSGYPGDRYECTSGFPVVNGFGYFTATAGHCGPSVNTPILSTNGEPPTTTAPYDRIRLTAWGSSTPSADAAIFSNSAPLAAIRVSSTQARVIRGGEDPALLESNVCFRGATSVVEKCGSVSRVNQVVTVSGRTFSAFCVYNLVALPGDSGAPIYKKVGASEARIRGLVSFRWDTNGDGTNDSVCGSPVSAVLRSTNSALIVA